MFSRNFFSSSKYVWLLLCVCVRFFFIGRFSFHHMQEFEFGISFLLFFCMIMLCILCCTHHPYAYAHTQPILNAMHKCNAKNGTIITFSLFQPAYKLYKHLAKCDKSLCTSVFFSHVPLKTLSSSFSLLFSFFSCCFIHSNQFIKHQQNKQMKIFRIAK